MKHFYTIGATHMQEVLLHAGILLLFIMLAFAVPVAKGYTQYASATAANSTLSHARCFGKNRCNALCPSLRAAVMRKGGTKDQYKQVIYTRLPGKGIHWQQCAGG